MHLLRGAPALTALLILAAAPPAGAADTGTPPRREVRAVWITTAAGLDWPKSRDRAEQQRSLRSMVATLHAARFNTIFFQVRARGDAYYRPGLEPWAENLTGTLGKDPGWDPLQFLLDEAHAAGIEVHGWFNVFKVRGPARPGPSSPQHPARAHPDWIVPYESEGWCDPGRPDVQTYLLRVALDLVRRYDMDGLHLDFIRYPGRDFPDDESYRRYGRGENRDDWRRGNVNRFVAALYDSVAAVRPHMKVGSAPLGVYRGGNGANGYGAYANYYQDSQGWLSAGKQDYLAPQIYWDIGESPGDPDFAALVRSWVAGGAGRHVYAGIGAYKQAVLEQIPQQIDIAREAGMSGEAFFRFEHVSDPAVLGGRYDTWANIPPMPWKDPLPPAPPPSMAVTESAPGVFSIEWTPSPPAADGDRAHLYNIYRWTSADIPLDNPHALAAVVPGTRTIYTDTLSAPEGARYYYAVSALDRASNESTPTTGSASVQELVDLRTRLTAVTSLVTLTRDPSTPLIAFALAAGTPVTLELRPFTPPDTGATVLANGMHGPGRYVVGIPRGRFTPGRYVVRLTAGFERLEQPVDLP